MYIYFLLDISGSICPILTQFGPFVLVSPPPPLHTNTYHFSSEYFRQGALEFVVLSSTLSSARIYDLVLVDEDSFERFGNLRFFLEPFTRSPMFQEVKQLMRNLVNLQIN